MLSVECCLFVSAMYLSKSPFQLALFLTSAWSSFGPCFPECWLLCCVCPAKTVFLWNTSDCWWIYIFHPFRMSCWQFQLIHSIHSFKFFSQCCWCCRSQPKVTPFWHWCSIWSCNAFGRLDLAAWHLVQFTVRCSNLELCELAFGIVRLFICKMFAAEESFPISASILDPRPVR